MKNAPEPLTLEELRDRVAVVPSHDGSSQSDIVATAVSDRVTAASLVLEEIAQGRFRVIKGDERDFEKLPFVDDLRATFHSLRYVKRAGIGGTVTVAPKDHALMKISFG